MRDILEREGRIIIYGNIYNGKYTHMKNELKEYYDMVELCYIDFYYNIYEDKLNKLKGNNFSVLFQQKEKIIVIREIEIINSKKIKELLKKYKNKFVLIGSGECIKNINNLELYRMRIENERNYEKKRVKNYIEDKKLKVIKKDNNIDLELYININNLFYKEMSNVELLSIFNNEKILFPLLVHENYKKIINSNIKSKKEIKENIIKISEIFKNYINYEHDILNNHRWYLYDILCLYLCKEINNILDKTKEMKYIDLEYTRILTKNSIKSKNVKNYVDIFKKINIIHNFDYLLIKYINKILIINLKYNVKKFKEDLTKYGYNQKDFIKIIKNTNEYYFIDNLNDIKKNMRN